MRRGFESEPALCPPRQRPLPPAAYHQSPPPPAPLASAVNRGVRTSALKDGNPGRGYGARTVQRRK